MNSSRAGGIIAVGEETSRCGIMAAMMNKWETLENHQCQKWTKMRKTLKFPNSVLNNNY